MTRHQYIYTGAANERTVKSTSCVMRRELAELASNLADAHRTGRPVRLTPDLEPADLRSAYKVQKAVARALVTRPAGWKVASTPHGCVAAPLLAHTTIAGGASWPAALTGVTGLEFEIAFRLSADISASEDWKAFFETLEGPYLGIELIGSRYAVDQTVSFPAFLADNLGNAGYILGEKADADLISQLGEVGCRVEVDGRTGFEGAAQHPNKNPLDLLRSCLLELRGTLPLLRAGQIITTGSICGVVPVDSPRYVEAGIEGYGSVQCAFSHAEPDC